MLCESFLPASLSAPSGCGMLVCVGAELFVWDLVSNREEPVPSGMYG